MAGRICWHCPGDTSPPVVAISASQDASSGDITVKSISYETVLFPLGLFWAAPPPAGIAPPPVMPPPPPEALSPEARPSETWAPTDTSCASTTTLTITVVISYPMDADGTFHTSLETLQPRLRNLYKLGARTANLWLLRRLDSDTATFVSNLSSTFCNDWATRSRTQSFIASSLTSPAFPGQYIHFEWKPDHVSRGCRTQAYCDRTLSSLLSYCEQYGHRALSYDNNHRHMELGNSNVDAYKNASTTHKCGTWVR
nr:hypothetical protein CFP56_22554 [Quercus suber]